MVCYKTSVFVITIVTGEYTVLLLQKHGFKFCTVLFGFWSSCLKVYIHLRCINTQKNRTTQFDSWSPLSQVNLLSWYYENAFLRFVWYRLVLIQLIIKFISIYPASTHSDEQHHHLKSLMSYHLATTKNQDCIRGQPIVVRDVVTLI